MSKCRFYRRIRNKLLRIELLKLAIITVGRPFDPHCSVINVYVTKRCCTNSLITDEQSTLSHFEA